MKAYAFNHKGEFIGTVDCQPNPLEFGQFLVPGMATEVEPPKPSKGKVVVWDGQKWHSKKIVE
jgi:hypothetical protein